MRRYWIRGSWSTASYSLDARNVTTVTVSSTYPFTFILPIWTSYSSTLSVGTTLSF